MNRFLLILSFLLVGMILVVNEPPTYSKEKTKEYPEYEYDLSSVTASIEQDALSIIQEQNNLKHSVKMLRKDNASLRHTVSNLKEQVELYATIEKDTITVSDSIVKKR